jgi:protein-S-isoprenylcysteine O-methyltransferase Ste14
MSSQPVNQRVRIRILQAGGLLLIGALLFAQPALAGDGHERIEVIALALVFVCIAGRMWSILYIGSKKNGELVTEGPYSMTRNPLYVFSMVGAVGIGLFVGSFILALALGIAAYLVLAVTAEKEARHLESLFGDRYRDYARETPLFWPKPLLYRDADLVTFSPVALRRTFLDGLFFIAAFPAIELIEHLQVAGRLPILFTLF